VSACRVASLAGRTGPYPTLIRGNGQPLSRLENRRRHKTKVYARWHCPSGALWVGYRIPRRAGWLLGRPHGGFERARGGHMPEASLVSVVEDDRFFRESMRRLMRSLGYSVEAFPSAADFLASPRLVGNRLLDRRRPHACDERSRSVQAPHRRWRG
jgi:hypothetical protein